MPPQSQSKKRPPPITIPPPQKARVVPGPNAFAVTTKGKRDGPNEDKDMGHSTSHSPAISPLDDPSLSHPGSQHSRKDGSSRSSAMAAVMDFARGSSPRKSGGNSSTNSHHAPAPMSSIKSRYSHRSHRSTGSSRPATAGQQHSLGENDEHATARGQIESRTEKKLFKMMGQIPGSPAAENEYASIAQVGRYSDTLKSQDIDGKKPEEPTKSPKKKLFGMSIPFSRSSTPSAPPMPSKAAQLLGTDTGVAVNVSPSSMRRNPPRHIKSTPRSDTSKSLPAKILDHHGQSRRPNQYGSPRARNRMPSHQTRMAEKMVQEKGPRVLKDVLGSSSSLGNPPTPPAKDTPREIKIKGNLEHIQGPTIPNFFTPAIHVPASGGRSPTKFCPYTAEDYAQLIELQPVLSSHGQVGCTEPEGIVSELEGDTEYPGLNKAVVVQKNDPQRQGKLQEKYSTNELNGDGLLKPAFYSPDSFSANLFEGGRPSHNAQADQHHWLFAVPPQQSTGSMRSNTNAATIKVMFQGTKSEIDPAPDIAQAGEVPTPSSMPSTWERNDPDLTAKVMRELRIGEQSERSEQADSSAEPRSQLLQPEQSSSKLTDILSGISPSRAGYNNINFYANCPSAVPSPLRGPPGQQEAHQTIYCPGPVPFTALQSSPENTLGGGCRSGDPFESIHGHLAADTQWLYDTIEDSKRETLRNVDEKHKDFLPLWEKHFDGIKADIHSIGQKTDRTSEQSLAINAKLDRLFDIIRNEFVEPQAAQGKRMAELESNMKDMQKAMHTLAGSIESKTNQHSANSQAVPSSFSQLPHHRSQPSLVEFYSSTTHDPARGLTTIPEARLGGGRFGYTYGHNTNGQWWNNRPAASGREGSENGSYLTSNANAYPSSPLPQYGGNYGLYPSGQNDDSLGYGQGGSK